MVHNELAQLLSLLFSVFEMPRGSTDLKEAVRVITRKIERQMIESVLGETEGNVTQGAKRLGISRKSLQTKMKEFGLRDPEE